MESPTNVSGVPADDDATRELDEANAWPESVDEAQRPAQLGRYTLGEVLGTGGMGVVYRAMDPKLGRHVALKLLRTDRARVSERSRGVARLQREAQAMAQLSHPNVITVFDVGTFRDEQAALLGHHAPEAFVAMELVEGVTMREWLAAQRPPWREALRTCVLAGRGLSAAHRAGLVHRDFKPSNILIGDDGRVRVMDFGLASTPTDTIASPTPLRTTHELWSPDDRLTQTGAILGTPAYMAPELFEGRSPDMRSDQFAFCATVFEAVYGFRPFAGKTFGELRRSILTGCQEATPSATGVPRHVRRAIARGLNHAAERRWESMDALLHQLERPRRRLLPALAVATVVGLAFAIPSASREADTRCASTLEGVWDADRRDALQAALAHSGASYAQHATEAVVDGLDGWATAWKRARAEACDGVPQSIERKMSCLSLAADEVRALVDTLTADSAEIIERAQLSVNDLPDPRACLDADIQAVPDAAQSVLAELARARALERTGQYADALAIAEVALDGARRAGHPATLAEALCQVGALRDENGSASTSADAFEEAVWVASAAGADALGARAATSLVMVVGLHLARLEEGHEWARHAEATLARMPDAEDAFARLLNNIGLLLDEEGRLPEARAAYLRALAIRERIHGPASLSVAKLLNNLGTLEFSDGDYETSLVWSSRALEIKTDVLGVDHPEVAKTLNNIGIAETRLGRFEQARLHHERALSIRERTLSKDHPLTATSLNNLANVLDDLREYDAALAMHERALAIRERALGPDHPGVSSSVTNLAAVYQRLERFDDARTMLRRALEIDERVLGPEGAEVGISLTNLAVLEHNLGAHDTAEKLARRALALVQGERGPDHHDTGRIVVLLAAITEAQEHNDDALALYTRALQIFSGCLPNEHPTVLKARSDRGWLYLDLARGPEAAADFELALAALEATPTADRNLRGSVHYGLAKALRASGADATRAVALAHTAKLDFASYPKTVAAIDRWLEDAAVAAPPSDH